MKTYTCTTCATEIKRTDAVLRGNAIDPEPTAWCRRDAVAAGILVLPMPELVVAVSVPASRKPVTLRERIFAQR